MRLALHHQQYRRVWLSVELVAAMIDEENPQ
jgi:hypothetical protein